jgi:hypothetical protein
MIRQDGMTGRSVMDQGIELCVFGRELKRMKNRNGNWRTISERPIRRATDDYGGGDDEGIERERERERERRKKEIDGWINEWIKDLDLRSAREQDENEEDREDGVECGTRCAQTNKATVLLIRCLKNKPIY